MRQDPVDSSAVPFDGAQIEWLVARDAYLDKQREARTARHFKRFRNSALAGFLVLAGGIGGAFYTSQTDSDASRSAIVTSGRAVSVSGCNRDFHTVNTLRGILLRAQAFQAAARERGDITQAAFERGNAYYAEQLAALRPVDCRPSADVVTDDPNKTTHVPVPEHR